MSLLQDKRDDSEPRVASITLTFTKLTKVYKINVFHSIVEIIKRNDSTLSIEKIFKL